MAKVNVNSATREDLVDVAGLRPEIADAVLEFRRKQHRITDAQALEELARGRPQGSRMSGVSR